MNHPGPDMNVRDPFPVVQFIYFLEISQELSNISFVGCQSMDGVPLFEFKVIKEGIAGMQA